jgi:hypothetical protein
VARAGETHRESPFKDIKSLANRAAEVDEPATVGDAGEPSEADKKLVSALAYARCSAAAEVDENARRAMGALEGRMRGEHSVTTQGSGQTMKILYRGL